MRITTDKIILYNMTPEQEKDMITQYHQGKSQYSFIGKTSMSIKLFLSSYDSAFEYFVVNIYIPR